MGFRRYGQAGLGTVPDILTRGAHCAVRPGDGRHLMGIDLKGRGYRTWLGDRRCLVRIPFLVGHRTGISLHTGYVVMGFRRYGQVGPGTVLDILTRGAHCAVRPGSPGNSIGIDGKSRGDRTVF